MPKPQPCRKHPGRYTNGCADCQAYNRAKLSERRHLLAAGKWELDVPAEQVAPHLFKLLNHMTAPQVATRTGVSTATVYAIKLGQRRWVRPDNAAAILGLPTPTGIAPATPPPVGCVPAVGPRRRVRALAVIGHSVYALGAACRVSRSTLQDLAADDVRLWVAADIAARIAAAYPRLSGIPGPSKVAASRADARGWHGPSAWSAATIDDPGANPDTGPLLDQLAARRTRHVDLATLDVDPLHVDLAVDGEFRAEQLNDAEIAAAIRILLGRGLTFGRIADRLRWPTRGCDAVAKWAERHGVTPAVLARDAA